MHKAEVECFNYTRSLLDVLKTKVKQLKNSTQEQIDEAHKTNAILNDMIDNVVTKGYEVKEAAQRSINEIVQSTTYKNWLNTEISNGVETYIENEPEDLQKELTKYIEITLPETGAL